MRFFVFFLLFLLSSGIANAQQQRIDSGSGDAVVSGSDTQVQFNDGGSLGASANLTFNSATNTLLTTDFTATDDISAGGNAFVSGGSLSIGSTGSVVISNSGGSLASGGGFNGDEFCDASGQNCFLATDVGGSASVSFTSAVTKTAAYTAANSDCGASYVEFECSSQCDFEVPDYATVAIDVGCEIPFARVGSGPVFISAENNNVNILTTAADDSLTLSSVGDLVTGTLKHVRQNTWHAVVGRTQ